MRPQLQDNDSAQYAALLERLRRVEQAEEISTGMIVLWKSTVSVPVGWVKIDGSAIDASTYPELAALWGATLLADPGITGMIAIVRAR